MLYSWWGWRRNVKLITLGSERVKPNTLFFFWLRATTQGPLSPPCQRLCWGGARGFIFSPSGPRAAHRPNKPMRRRELAFPCRSEPVEKKKDVWLNPFMAFRFAVGHSGNVAFIKFAPLVPTRVVFHRAGANSFGITIHLATVSFNSFGRSLPFRPKTKANVQVLGEDSDAIQCLAQPRLPWESLFVMWTVWASAEGGVRVT